MTKPNH